MIKFLGDIHGNFQPIVAVCLNNETKEPISLIQVGDFGAGFHYDFEEKMDYLNEILVEHNVKLFVMRGNHDDPKFFNGDYTSTWSNINFIQDYTTLFIEGKHILFIGGAISIDRLQRQRNISWWEDEVFVADLEKAAKCSNVDIVVTHTAPSFSFPTGFNWLVHSFAANDHTLLHELTIERCKVDDVYNEIMKNNKVEKWFYGHFHTSNKERRDDVDFILLGINEVYSL